MALTLTEIRQNIRDLPGCREEEAIGILETLLTRFPKKSVVADALLDAVMVIEGDIDQRRAEDADAAYRASQAYAQDVFAARSERGL